eukprot:691645-Amphidinium_carterae.1
MSLAMPAARSLGANQKRCQEKTEPIQRGRLRLHLPIESLLKMEEPRRVLLTPKQLKAPPVMPTWPPSTLFNLLSGTYQC